MSVSQGGQMNQELMDVLSGSAGYVERLKDLQAARQEAADALNNLKLGQNAAAALVDAKRTQAAAQQALAEANELKAKYEKLQRVAAALVDDRTAKLR